jgi:chromosome segregation and condensation protein ScpB
LSGRPYELVSVAGGWSFRTKLGFGDAAGHRKVGGRRAARADERGPAR